MTGPWWAAFGPAETQVTCGGRQHVIRWADGRLSAASHPDAEGELVMAALGGEPPRCVQIVQAWGAHADDLEVLAIGPRSAADPISVAMPGDDVDELWPARTARLMGPVRRRRALYSSAVAARRRRTATWGSSAAFRGRGAGIGYSRPMVSVPMTTHSTVRRISGGGWTSHGHDPAADRAQARLAELRMLLALGPAFQWRLAGTVADAWSAARPGHDPAAARPALTAALAGRLAPVAQAWLGADPDHVEVTVHDGAGWGRLAAAPAGGAQAAAGQQPGLSAALPPSWLARVWAPGLALVAGRLVVAVPEAQWPRARVLALTAPGTEPAPLDVRWEAGQWRPAADSDQRPDR